MRLVCISLLLLASSAQASGIARERMRRPMKGFAMKGSRRVLFWSSLAVTLLATSTIASARRAYEVEIGHFDASGALNGSITYMCEGGKYVEGVLVGTPRHWFWRDVYLVFDTRYVSSANPVPT